MDETLTELKIHFARLLFEHNPFDGMIAPN